MVESIRLRPLHISDAREMAYVLSSPALYEFTGGEPPTEERLKDLYASQTRGGSEDGSELWLNWIVTVGESGAAVGYVQATVPVSGGPTEIAWVIGRPWQGRGYAGRAVELMLGELRSRGVGDVVAAIHPDHAASQRVARRAGLEPSDEMVDGEVCWRGRLP